MEDKRLVRVFDQVKLSPEREDAMLADLLCEKKEVSSMKDTGNRSRIIPAAALAAAILVMVLAGTALAEGYFGRLDVSPVDGGYENGYNVRGAYQNIAPERLSEEVLERAAQMGKGYEEFIFSSWSEAEEFLGLEIADNAVLEEMARSGWEPSLPEGEPPHEHESHATLEDAGRCTVCMNYSLGLPDVIHLYTQYWGDDFEGCPMGLVVSAFMRVKGEGHEDRPLTLGNSNGQTEVEKYVTPSGMEAAIFTGGYDVVSEAHGTTYRQPSYSVYFTMNDTMFWLETAFSEENADTVLSGLKEVLDAFE